MEKMWAQVLTAPGQLQYKKTEIPAYKKDEILVKIKTAAICNGSDPPILEGMEEYPPPFVFGHEPLGEVAACGEAVKNFKVGDRVSWWFSLGAFGEYNVVNPAQVAMIKVPDFISDVEGPLLELMTASYRALKKGDINSTTNILILGLGPSGLIMSQRAKILGAAKVVGWDLYSNRRKKGLELGCDEVFSSADNEVVKKTRKAVNSIDLIIDAMGNDKLPEEPTFNKGLELLKTGGKIITYGHPGRGRRFKPLLFQKKDATLEAPLQDINFIQKLMEEGKDDLKREKLNLKALISHQIQLNEVEKGLKMVKEEPEKCLKIVVKI